MASTLAATILTASTVLPSVTLLGSYLMFLSGHTYFKVLGRVRDGTYTTSLNTKQTNNWVMLTFTVMLVCLQRVAFLARAVVGSLRIMAVLLTGFRVSAVTLVYVYRINIIELQMLLHFFFSQHNTWHANVVTFYLPTQHLAH